MHGTIRAGGFLGTEPATFQPQLCVILQALAFRAETGVG
jgi:hypothetical protein